MTQQTAYLAIAKERARQRTELGYSSEHDRHHGPELLIRAATCYLRNDITWWPWDRAGFKPRTHIRNLVRAGALFLAAADVALANPEHAECCGARAMRLHESTARALAAEISAVHSLAPSATRRLCDPEVL